jgi:uncharacterized protein YndB with AHSA1/START domain
MTDAPDPIVLDVTAEVTPARAWAAITEPAQVAEWFADVTPADGVGSPYRIDFGDGSVIEGRVRALEPGRRLAYTWTWAGEAGALTTLVTWEVEAAGIGTLIRLTHDGWAEAGADEATRDEHLEYWETYMDQLDRYLVRPA